MKHNHESFTECCPACGLAPRQIQPSHAWGCGPETKVSLWHEVESKNIQHSSHKTDLYLPVNEQTQKLIDAYEFKANVAQFTSQIDGKRWFDIPFAYLPAWEKKTKVS